MISPKDLGRRLDVGLLAGFAVLAALVLVALVTRVQLIAVFAAASIVASLLTSPRRTTVVGVAAVACSVLAGLVHDTVGPSTGSCGASSRLCCRLWPWSRRRCGNVASTACSG